MDTKDASSEAASDDHAQDHGKRTYLVQIECLDSCDASSCELNKEKSEDGETIETSPLTIVSSESSEEQ